MACRENDVERAGLDDLLRRARRRDPEALTRLVELYSPRVFGLLYRLTGDRHAAEDLVQETFLRVVRTIERYRHVGKFEPWLFRISANLARDHARASRRHAPPQSLEALARETELPAADGGPARASAAQSGLGRDEVQRRLAGALEQLSDADREIILLRHYSELCFREIAELLAIPLGTALARAHRALKHLRTALGEDEL